MKISTRHFRQADSCVLKFTPNRQTGTALITVVLIAAVVIVMVLESVKTLSYQKQLSSNLINRDQATSYLMGMEELAKIWLKKSFDNAKEETVHLNQTWAQDNITFPLDGGGMMASMKDMQSCFNLNSIMAEDTTQNDPGRNNPGQANPGQANPGQNNVPGNGLEAKTLGQEIFEELINQVNKSSEVTGTALASVTRDWLDEDTEPFEADGAEDGYYQAMEVPYRTGNQLLAHVSELLTMKDFNQAIYSELLPYVCVLPEQNVFEININTVPSDAAVLVFAALGAEHISLSDVSNALSSKGDKGFETVEEFKQEIGVNADKVEKKYWARLTTKSEYFQMSAKAEIGKTRVAMKTLFKKEQQNNFKVISRYFGKEVQDQISTGNRSDNKSPSGKI